MGGQHRIDARQGTRRFRQPRDPGPEPEQYSLFLSPLPEPDGEPPAPGSLLPLARLRTGALYDIKRALRRGDPKAKRASC